MAILLTILLIEMPMYVTVNAPPQRSFSYIEIWIIGMQVPTLVAVLESSVVLFLKRRIDVKGNNEVTSVDASEEQGPRFHLFDLVTSILLSAYFVLFQIIFWASASYSRSS